ncbi:Hpt domain-containing protein, partial [Pseudomonas sp. BAY1663]|uniref:Hpt domain-containing protein n=1 Tax=Pseudomonas sp. BAY1663 TaxID=1439940 RepID=UPI000569C12C
MHDPVRLELQKQFELLNQQFAQRLRVDLAELAGLTDELQRSQAPDSRRQLMLAIRERLHRLAGAAGTFGFDSLGERARRLEQ